MVGIETQRFLERVGGASPRAARREREAEVGVGVGVLGVDRDHPLEVAGGFVHPALLGQNHPQGVVLDHSSREARGSTGADYQALSAWERGNRMLEGRVIQFAGTRRRRP